VPATVSAPGTDCAACRLTVRSALHQMGARVEGERIGELHPLLCVSDAAAWRRGDG
jgi:hypothetical protein